MQKIRIVTLRDDTKPARLGAFIYNPNDPDVKEHYTRQNLWNVIPTSDRAWLYTYMQDKTPNAVFNENNFTPQKAVSLLNGFPQWIKEDRAFKVMLNDLAQLNNKSQAYNVFRYFKDHYLIHSIELKYGTFNGIAYDNEQRTANAENAFNMWYSDFVSGWGSENGGFFGTIMNIGTYVLDFFIPGAGAVARSANDVLNEVGLTGIQAQNGDVLYYPDFSKDLSVQFIPTDTMQTTQAGFSLLPMLLIGGVAFAMLSGRKK